MIFFVVTDSPANYAKAASWHQTHCLLEKLADDTCLTLSYERLTPRLLRDLHPWAVVHSGAAAFIREYPILKHEGYRHLVTRYPGAQIGLCGGHQLIAMVLGSTCNYIGKLPPDQPDLAGYAPGYFKEWGIYPVRIVEPDPLFAGLPRTLRVQEYHCWEVKTLGPQLRLLATSQGTHVQAYRHRRRLLYGTQFHPENATDTYPHGYRILKNFFDLARRHARQHP